MVKLTGKTFPRLSTSNLPEGSIAARFGKYPILWFYRFNLYPAGSGQTETAGIAAGRSPFGSGKDYRMPMLMPGRLTPTPGP
jgi:hypothetical protein